MKYILVASCLAVSVCAASDPKTGTFTNLGFDDPIITFPPNLGLTKDILNGWTLTAVDGQVPIVISVGPTVTAPTLTFAQPYKDPLPSFGQYQLFFVNFVNHEFELTPTYALKQVGKIPELALELQIYYDWFGTPPPSDLLQCRINGQNISTESSSWGGGIWELPVSAYAGQEVELEFVLGPRTSLFFDIAGFTSVPEPSTWALLGLGGLAAFGWAGRRRKRPSSSPSLSRASGKSESNDVFGVPPKTAFLSCFTISRPMMEPTSKFRLIRRYVLLGRGAASAAARQALETSSNCSRNRSRSTSGKNESTSACSSIANSRTTSYLVRPAGSSRMR